ncbi:hypothetical protein ABZ990_03075 [Streptomyces sp. NPDC046203]|uniref:hypothetical protein n=1 Tax=Streptomyces sp. NPDC046203 TaxID=3154602 RepID=UPI0033C21491
MITKKKSRGKSAAIVAGVLTALSMTLSAAPAMAQNNPMIEGDYDQWWAVETDGTTTFSARCADHTEQQRFRFYYSPNYQGAFINIGHPLYDLLAVYAGDGAHPLTFCGGGGAGWGQNVGNNAASVYNWYNGYCGTVYYYAGYNRKGAYKSYWPNSGGNLQDAGLRNNNRSIEFSNCW